MNEIESVILACVAGVLVGIFFYGGLWWTVQRGLRSSWPALWFVGSLIVRTSITLFTFYLVSDGHWLRLLFCMVGFTVAGKIITRTFSTGVGCVS
jgi:F1F0 ATPase subunit 2